MHRSSISVQLPPPPTPRALWDHRCGCGTLDISCLTPADSSAFHQHHSATSQGPWPFPSSHLPPTSSTDTETPKKDRDPKETAQLAHSCYYQGTKGEL